MIEIDITNEMLIEARDKAVELGNLRNSILNGGGNLAGFLGEVVANSVINGTITNTKDYDILLTNGLKIDVKTKQTTVVPKEDYECSIAEYNTIQHCDVYLFVRVLKNFSKGWILGYLSKDEYFKKATYLKKGEIDGSNKFVVKANCYNVKISDLKKIKTN